MTDTDLENECNRLFFLTDGKLIRKISVAPNARAGSEAGCFDKSSGYRRVRVFTGSYLTHRLIFLMTYGFLPEVVDHINGDVLDNRPENLREAGKLENRWNCKGNSGTISGYKGVYYDRGRWKALLTFKGVRYYLGMFSTKEEAKDIVQNKYKELQKDFAYKG